VDLIDLPEFGPDDYAQIVDGEPDPFGTDQLGISWREKSAHLGLAHDGRLIAHAAWVRTRARTTTGTPVGVVGLGSVLVHRKHRGAGVGRQLVSGAMTRMGELDTPVGMLFCRTPRVPFYESLGWHPVDATVTVDQPAGPVVMPLVTCWAPLIDQAYLPDGDLRIEGLPF
jgi:GNAT superfamily N-acetyltransferase